MLYRAIASLSCTVKPVPSMTSKPLPSPACPTHRKNLLVLCRAVTPRTIRPVFSCQVHGEYRDYKNFVAGQTIWVEFWICFIIVPVSLVNYHFAVNILDFHILESWIHEFWLHLNPIWNYSNLINFAII